MPSPLQNRDRWRKVAHNYRRLPGLYGLRPYRVFAILRSYSGDHTGEGSEDEEETEILENGVPPKVRFLKDEEIALNNLSRGSVEVGPITPDCSVGGVSIATLRQTAAETGDVVHFKLEGPSGTSVFRLVEVSDDRALHYSLKLEPVANAVE